MLNTSTIDCLVIRLFSCKSVVVLSCLLLDLYFVCRLTEWGINVTWIVVFLSAGKPSCSKWFFSSGVNMNSLICSAVWSADSALKFE